MDQEVVISEAAAKRVWISLKRPANICMSSSDHLITQNAVVNWWRPKRITARKNANRVWFIDKRCIKADEENWNDRVPQMISNLSILHNCLNHLKFNKLRKSVSDTKKYRYWQIMPLNCRYWLIVRPYLIRRWIRDTNCITSVIIGCRWIYYLFIFCDEWFVTTWQIKS